MYDANQQRRFLLDTGMFGMVAFYLYKHCSGSKLLRLSPLLRLLVRDGKHSDHLIDSM